MQMLFCPNCQKHTGFKRALGFGTFFMVLITFGLWLLVIPFYPARCITCGLTRGTAIVTSMPKWAQALGVVVLLAIVCAIILTPSQSSHPVPIIKGSDYNEVRSPKHDSGRGSRAVPVSLADEVISVDSTSLLAAYQADERVANARYENKRVAVTGVLSGVFIPSIDVSMRMAGKGLAATAFVTMGGPQPHSVEEVFSLPGIQAHSGISSFFGQQNTTAVTNKLRIGETVTLACTCGEGFRVSDLGASPYNGIADYSVRLDDCTLQNNPPEASYLPSETPLMAVDSGNGAASDGSSVVYHVGGAVSPPKAVFAPDPEYTDDARHNKIKGTNVFTLIVTEEGTAKDIKVLRSLDPGLDASSIRSIQTWRFLPATKDGKPVAAQINVETTYRLYDNTAVEQPKPVPKRCSILAKLANRCAPTGTK